MRSTTLGALARRAVGMAAAGTLADTVAEAVAGAGSGASTSCDRAATFPSRGFFFDCFFLAAAGAAASDRVAAGAVVTLADTHGRWQRRLAALELEPAPRRVTKTPSIAAVFSFLAASKLETLHVGWVSGRHVVDAACPSCPPPLTSAWISRRASNNFLTVSRRLIPFTSGLDG